ncbi:MAG: metallophosphoesterase [Actinobacteria bacterium]|nr:metallophosphoesterase [Actinomycetota bacterium]
MKIFYAGDVHGSERCFRKFLNSAAFYDADVLIMGGDITGKVMTPLVEEKPGRYVATVFGHTEKAKRERDVLELEEQIRFNGFYPLRCSPAEFERLGAEEDYREAVMSRLMVEEVARWVGLADERLAGTDVRCLIMPGNDDEFEIDDVLDSSRVENPDGKVLRLGEVQLLSSSWANPTPWSSPREEDEAELTERLEAIAAGLDPELPAIFNLHVPPYDSGLDTAPQIDADLSVVTVGGQPSLIPVGSKAVRRLIEERRPILGLHGHIHECRNAIRLGETVCINPGSNYADGVLDGAIVEVEGGRLGNYQLVSG